MYPTNRALPYPDDCALTGEKYVKKIAYHKNLYLFYRVNKMIFPYLTENKKLVVTEVKKSRNGWQNR